MDGDGEQKQGNRLGVVRGGKYVFRGRRRGPRLLTKSEHELDRRMQTAFARVTDVHGNVPGKPLYNIREGVQFPWRHSARLTVFIRSRPMSRSGKEAYLDTIREFYNWAREVLDVVDRSADQDLPRAA